MILEEMVSVSSAETTPAETSTPSQGAALALVSAIEGNKKAIGPTGVPAITKQEQVKVVKQVRQELKFQRKELKKVVRSGKAQGSDYPLNDGVTAALLILGLGVVLLLLAAILPSVISLIGWILGVVVLLVGVTFLVLTLLGFDVRIIG